MRVFFYILCVFALSNAAASDSRLDRIVSQKSLAVCIWPDYYSVTFRNPKSQQLSGIDIDLSQALAKDLGVTLRYVDSSFARLFEDVLNDRCDVAMFAVGMLPTRMEKLRFTKPYLKSDIYGITTKSHPVVKTWEDLDRPGVIVAVQAGTFMEPVMRERLKHSELLVVAPPMTREQEVEAGRADAFMTDFPYSRRLIDNADWARLLVPRKPFFVLPYAYAVKPGDDRWLQRLDQFVADIKRDGRLQTAARRAGLEPILVRD